MMAVVTKTILMVVREGYRLTDRCRGRNEELKETLGNP